MRNRRRSLLTIVSVAASLCLLGLLAAIYRVLFFGGEAAPAQALRFITHHKVSLAQSLPIADVEQIRRVRGVEAATAWQWFGGTYREAQDPRNFFARFAVAPSEMFRVWPDYTIPEDQRLAFESRRTACLASRTLADKFGWRPGERITLVGDFFPVSLDLTLVGIFDGAENNEVLYFSHDYLRESLPAGSLKRDLVSQVMVKIESPDDASQVAQQIDALFENSPDPTTTESERLFLLNFVSFLGNFKLFLAAICGAVAFTLLLVTGNTLSMSVRERVREVGILKTLGFTRSAVLGMILGEATVITLTGGVIGCLLASLSCAVIRQIAPAFIPGIRTLAVTPSVVGLSLVVALLIGLASALPPALSASRMPILNTLRHTG
ncbi:MAG TPA: FtsX-like permease family protein [Blastocatellia bacterium]|nr:FtsX-like permease family protein [Blastocatellia bacterium]